MMCKSNVFDELKDAVFISAHVVQGKHCVTCMESS